MSMPPFTIDAKARAWPVMSPANRPGESSARPGRSSLSARFGGHDPAYRGQEGEGIPPPRFPDGGPTRRAVWGVEDAQGGERKAPEPQDRSGR